MQADTKPCMDSTVTVASLMVTASMDGWRPASGPPEFPAELNRLQLALLRLLLALLGVAEELSAAAVRGRLVGDVLAQIAAHLQPGRRFTVLPSHCTVICCTAPLATRTLIGSETCHMTGRRIHANDSIARA